jgi:hypothetical protein
MRGGGGALPPYTSERQHNQPSSTCCCERHPDFDASLSFQKHSLLTATHPPLSTVAMMLMTITSRCQRGRGAAIRSSWMMILVVLFACEGIAFSRPALVQHQRAAPSPSSSTRRNTMSTAGRWPATSSSTVRIDRHAVDPRRATTTTARTLYTKRTLRTTTRHRTSTSAMALQSLRGGGGGVAFSSSIVVTNFSRLVRYIGQKRSRCLMILAAAILLESCATGLSKRAKDTGSVATFLVAASLNIMWYVAVSLLLVLLRICCMPVVLVCSPMVS